MHAQTKQSLKLITIKHESQKAFAVGTHVLSDTCLSAAGFHFWEQGSSPWIPTPSNPSAAVALVAVVP